MKTKKQNTKSAELTRRTIEIINKNGRILLKQKKSDWYLGCWTNVASGPDRACWSRYSCALEFFNLEWAFTIAPLYGCKVVVRYPKAGLKLPVEVKDSIDNLINRKKEERSRKKQDKEREKFLDGVAKSIRKNVGPLILD